MVKINWAMFIGLVTYVLGLYFLAAYSKGVWFSPGPGKLISFPFVSNIFIVVSGILVAAVFLGDRK